MATLHHDQHNTAAIHVKGAPERILAMCADQQAEGDKAGPLDAEYWQRAASEIAAQGQRVLAIATRRGPEGARKLTFDDVEGGLTLLGLVGLIDPPREEAIAAVAECQAAGIRVKMITGDHAGTALAIARQLGLENTEAVLEGAQIDGLSTEQLREHATRIDVFARTSPEHKLRLVEALQASGLVVAMTGDGVNDAPSLKRADIGIAMGRTGTEAAKEAAEIVLADDNFATITAAIQAGRTVYDNLQKAIVFLLPVNGGEALALIAALLLGLTLPITPVQILWVNMVSSVVLAMALAFEGPEPGIMLRPPRPASEAILSRFVMWRVAFVSILFCAGIFGMFTWAQRQGASIEEARTIAVNTLVVMEIFYLFSVRFLNTTSLSFEALLGTRPVLIAIAVVTALQFLFTYAPFMEAFFDTRPLSLAQGLTVIAVGPALLVILEIEKRVLLHRTHRPGNPGQNSQSESDRKTS
jgi:magnesium-transporting ATPase (P-type)